jgi:hypothetical protein
MSKLLATRTVQRQLTAEFVFNYNDWAIDSVSQVKTTFGSTVALADPSSVVSGLTAGTGVVLDAVPMPIGAVITGGEVIVETAFVGIGAGATLNLGVAGNTAALVSALDLDAAAAGSRTALLLTAPLLCNAGVNIRLTTAGLTATATAGKVRVRVNYTIDGKADETVIA